MLKHSSAEERQRKEVATAIDAAVQKVVEVFSHEMTSLTGRLDTLGAALETECSERKAALEAERAERVSECSELKVAWKAALEAS